MFEKIQRLLIKVFHQSYAKAGIYYIIANVIGQGVVFFSTALFTRMMSKADYGLVNTYMTWVYIINSFISLNVFTSTRTAFIDFKDEYDKYNSSVLVLCIFSGVLFSVVIMSIAYLCGLAFDFLSVLFVCVQSVALNVINYQLAVQAMKNEYNKRVFMIIAPNIAHTILSVVFMLIFTQYLYYAKIAGNAIGLIIFAVICTVMIFNCAKPMINKKYWKYALFVSVPLIFNTLSDILLTQCDRLMLTDMVGAEETAEYAVVYNFGTIITTIYIAINGAWVPWFFNKVNENDGESTKYYQKIYMLVFNAFCCGILTITPEFIKLISPANYWSGIDYILPIIISSYLIFLYVFFTMYLLYKKRTLRIAVNTIFAAVLNIILNYIWIPQYMAEGAAMATLVSYSALFLLNLSAVGRQAKVYFAIPSVFENILIIVLYSSVFYYTKDNVLVRYLLYIVLLAFIYIFGLRKMLTKFMGEGA